MIAKNEQRFQQLEDKRRQLTDELLSLDEAVLTLPEKEGAWSVLQCLHHLYITEWGTDKYIRKKTQKPETIPPVDLMTKVKLQVVKVTFASPIKFKAPMRLPQAPTDITLPQLTTDWDEVRGNLHELMETLPDDLQQKGLFRHPLAGRISMSQTLNFFDFHFDRHLGQVRRILKNVS